MATKRVSRLPGGTVPRKTAGRNRGYIPPVLAPEPPRIKNEQPGPGERGFKKGPTSEQFTAMSGAMYNALTELRSNAEFIRWNTEKNCGWLQPAMADEAYQRIIRVENLLRVGLKARFRK